MPFGGQIGPESAFFELGSHWGQQCAVLTGRGGAFRRPISLVRPRGSHFFQVRRCHVGVFALFPARPRAEKKKARFCYVLGIKRTRLPEKRSRNKARVRRKSLRKPVACVYYDLPPRGRARWTENHPRERGTRETRETSHQATKWRMTTHLFLAITLMAVSGADKHLWRTRPPGPLSGARATDAPPQGHAGDTRC